MKSIRDTLTLVSSVMSDLKKSVHIDPPKGQAKIPKLNKSFSRVQRAVFQKSPLASPAQGTHVSPPPEASFKKTGR